eukprot:scaffold27560_cov142-Isochrysis_galbana.AAC.4
MSDFGTEVPFQGHADSRVCASPRLHGGSDAGARGEATVGGGGGPDIGGRKQVGRGQVGRRLAGVRGGHERGRLPGVPDGRSDSDPGESAHPQGGWLQLPDGAFGPGSGGCLALLRGAHEGLPRRRASAVPPDHAALCAAEPCANRRRHVGHPGVRQRGVPVLAGGLHPDAQGLHAHRDPAHALPAAHRDALAPRLAHSGRHVRRNSRSHPRGGRAQRDGVAHHAGVRDGRGPQARPHAEASAEQQLWGAPKTGTRRATARPRSRHHARPRAAASAPVDLETPPRETRMPRKHRDAIREPRGPPYT